MSIQILPARLANQIAAGEVVERPASVVKELVENSLDAGATRIEIDIEKGGAKCIRIKDNGKGVCKDQLTLALSRHATSKISHLDDLEAIVSLGFRGEALASISSVSRLTFTSKPENQDQAWQAVAEGRDMQVHIQPAAHPQGTTVEVLDLFFNTPARRRFLKTEKTEFQHIDELIRRIALSSFEVSFVLKHNGKVIRQYRSAQTTGQIDKRLAAICSESFVRSALSFKSDGFENENADDNKVDNASKQSDQLKISGWISDRLSPRLLGDVQYCYINGRMIRDKLVNHAIKQAYARLLPEGQFPGYVIYINCPADQVDVNVHPSKHEVRFHQARWVHDYIVNTLARTLNSDTAIAGYQQTEHGYQPPTIPDANQAFLNQGGGDAGATQSSAETYHQRGAQERSSTTSQNRYPNHSQGSYQTKPLDDQQVEGYCNFVSEAYHPVNTLHEDINPNWFDVISLIQNQYVLMKLPQHKALILLSLPATFLHVEQLKLMDAWQNGEVISQPLLLPVRIELNSKALAVSERFSSLFSRFGFSFKKQANKLIISKVPALLRQAAIAKVLPVLLDSLIDFDSDLNETQVNEFCTFMVQLLAENKRFDATEIQPLLVSFNAQSLLAHNTLYIEPELSLLLQGFADE